jgi:hypothetical protein
MTDESQGNPDSMQGLVASYSAHRFHLREKKTKEDPRVEAGGSEER